MENFLLLNSLIFLISLLKNKKLALLITTFLSSIFSLSKKFFWLKKTFNFLISAIDLSFLLSSIKILESLIKKCGAGRIRYEISAEELRLILNSFRSFFSTVFCTQFLSYKRGINR